MRKWQRVTQRQGFGWVILLGFAGILGILHMEIIPFDHPFSPLVKIQSHLYNYFHVHGESQKSSPHELKKNRIAICLVGGARKFELTGPSLLEYVVNRYNNSDLFLNAPLDKDSYKFRVLKEASSGLAAVRIFTPQRINETKLQREVFTSKGSPNGLQGLLQYFDLVEGCLTMIKSYQIKHNIKYDWIIRTRVDGYWNGPLPPPESYSNKMYIVPPGSQYGGGYRGLNSEAAFKHQLDVKGVEYMFKTFPFCILTEHKYVWPPSQWGVPVASLSSNEDLNGAYCRPCTPVLRGHDAMNYINDNLIRSWSWGMPTPGLELCDAHDSWEVNWEQLFDKVAGPKFSALRQKFKKHSLNDCIKDFEAMKDKTADWDSPPLATI
ncbi:hypothetical protein KI387_042002, partial [Taxus chinensis]